MENNVREFYLSADDLAWETVAKVFVEEFPNGQKWATVLHVAKDDQGRFYYGFVEGKCGSAILSDKSAVVSFLEENSDQGFSVGSFDSLEDMNEDFFIFFTDDRLFQIFGTFDLGIFDKYTK